MTRLERMKDADEDYQPPMPEVGAAHLLGYLFEVGPLMTGPAPVTHQEIEAWQRTTGVSLTPWESRVIRRLSVEYLNEAHNAAKPDCPAPWEPVDYVPDNRATARSMQKAIEGLLKI